MTLEPLDIRHDLAGPHIAAQGDRVAMTRPGAVEVRRGAVVERALSLSPVHGLAFAGERLLASPWVVDLATGGHPGLPRFAAEKERSPTLVTSALSPSGDLLVVSVQHRPPRGRGAGPGPSEPHRILTVSPGGGAPHILHSGRPGPWSALAVSADHIAAATTGILMFPRKRPKPTAHAGHEFTVRALRFTPDGATLASGDAAGHVALWRVAGGAPQLWKAHTDEARALAWHPDGAWLATGGVGPSIAIWSPSGERLAQVDVEGRVDGLAVSGDTLWAAVGLVRPRVVAFRVR